MLVLLLALTRCNGRCGRHARQVIDDVIGNNHTVVDRAQPARHDNSAASSVVQTTNLLRQRAADGQTLELGAETGAIEMLGVMFKRYRCGRFGVNDPLSTVRNVLFKGIQSRFDQVLFACFVFFFRHSNPIVEVRVGRKKAGGRKKA